MAQHDYLIADQSGLSFLSDLNQLTAAIVSNNSGGVEPTDLYAYMWWADTTSGLLKRRNAANNAWIDFASLSTGLIIGTNVQAYDATTVLEADLIASNITNTPVGNITSTNQQDVNNELDAMMYRKNYIINGGFDIWQRGTSGTSGYVADRFTTTNTTSVSKVTSSLSGFGSAMQVVTTPSSDTMLRQQVENTEGYLAGQTMTLSFWMKSDIAEPFGTGQYCIYQDATETYQILGVSVPSVIETNGDWKRYIRTFTLPATATGHKFSVRLDFNKTTSQTLEITGVQLELGSVATPFEHRSYGEELALCHRYGRPVNLYSMEFIALTATTVRGGVPVTTPMRTTPTVTKLTESSVRNTSLYTSASSVIALIGTDSGFNIQISGFTGLTADAVYIGNSAITAFLDAEL